MARRLPQLFVVGPKRRIVAGLHEFFSFGLAARADVDEKVVAGHGLPAFLRLFQVNGLGADDTRDGLVSDLDPNRRQDAVVNAADRVEAQKTIVFYVRHQKTHFVHMGGEHDVGTGKVRPLAGEQVAHRVDPHLVDEAADLLTDVSTYRGLVARHAAAAQTAQISTRCHPLMRSMSASAAKAASSLPVSPMSFRSTVSTWLCM